MRRTYRSKKDVGGGLGLKDFVYALDDKSSAFDAFYIQNIKQTKKELSCITSSNQYRPVSNKVRKKKYVKRVNKESEPTVEESMFKSTYLTPDKSIHVNKEPDLFDQLLNSSGPNISVCKNKLSTKINNRFKKTYCSKKNKKANFSTSSDSESSDSGKENASSEISNVLLYELNIEKEANKNAKQCDDSINRIVNNISLFKIGGRSKRSQNTSFNTYASKFKNRLTQNLKSPLLQQNSPISSTPFIKKSRTKSIYKFSPIPYKDVDESPTTITPTNDNKEISNSSKSDKNVNSREENTPLTHFVTLRSTKHVESPLFQNDLNLLPVNVHDNSKNIVPTEIIDITDGNSTDISEVPFLGFPDSNTNVDKDNNQNTKEANEIQDCVYSLDQSDVNESIPDEPFLGFTNVESEMADIPKTTPKKKYWLNNTNCEESFSSTKGNVSTHSSTFSDTIEERQSLYDTCNSDDSDHNVSENSKVESIIKQPVVKIKRLNDSLFNKYYKSYKKNSGTSNEDKNTSRSTNYDENECFSELSETEYNDSEEIYRNEITDNDLSTVHKEDNWRTVEENISTHSISINNESKLDENDSISAESVLVSKSNTDCKDCDSINSIHLINPDPVYVTSSSNDEEDACVSFVTTRRGNEIINNSFLLLDSSQNSTSSNDGNKTVISHNSKHEKVNQELNEGSIKPNLVSTDVALTEFKDDRNTSTKCFTNMSSNKSCSPRPRSVRNSEVLLNNSSFEGIRPSIVLQAGKKWERSLSIYKRMTMANDHLDHSAMDEDDIVNKGRNYRQSIIRTMEMQKHREPIDNESIISRSSFSSKPRRSTIKILRDSRISSFYDSTLKEDFIGFLTEDCDDTIIELSKLSLAGPDLDVVEKVHDTSGRVTSARDFVLRRCNQTDAVLFDECYPDTVLKNCHKIGEGVYGEVFLWRAGDGRARVMKIVPIGGTLKVNGEHQKDFNEIISEIVIAMELSALRAPIAELEALLDAGKEVDANELRAIENATDVFNEVLAVRCVYGHYPSRLLDLWDLYDECRGSENDNPAVLPVDQQYIVLELANAGQDLESYQFNNAEQAHALFLQVALGLAVAEESHQFEHRDLHWGNILVSPTDQKYVTFVLRGRLRRAAARGARAALIDYSLARALCAGAALYHDLAADDTLFDAVGDYQFEVYRLMRDKLSNDWKNFDPYTNILWLHYTVDKMITSLRYKRTNTKIHKHYISKLNGIKDRILNYGSAVQFVLTDNEF